MKLCLALVTVASLLTAACDGSDGASASATGAAAAPLAVGRGLVDTEPGVVVVAAPSDGIVQAVEVGEGEAFAAGATLARLDDRLARLTLDVSRSDIRELDARVAAAATQVEAAGAEAARRRRLADADAGTRQEADQADVALQTARLQRRIALDAAGAARSRLQLQAYAVNAQVVTAPVAGRVLRRLAVAGNWVAQGSPLFELEPQGERIVRAEMDEAYADRLRPGMAATVSLEANPARTFPARIERVAERFGPSTIAADPTAPSDTRSLGVVLSIPASRAVGLRLGQRVLVRVTR